MKGKVLLIAGLVLLAGCEKEDKGPWSGPFGTKQGLTADQISAFAKLEVEFENKESGQTTYISPQAPDMSSEASSYRYVLGKTSGLCMVSASIDDVRGSDSKLPDDLTKKYGKPVKDQSVDWGVVWSSDRFKLDNDLKAIRITFSGQEPRINALVQAVYVNSGSECN